tara:strand:- start:331 stop:609 length:279 start_codon:yes stop_codon:yes gene_type:complete
MFTFRFESESNMNSDCCSTDDPQKIVLATQAEEYRLLYKRGVVDVLIPNKNGVEIHYPIGDHSGAYDRCFIMNDNGATIDKIVKMEPVKSAS